MKRLSISYILTPITTIALTFGTFLLNSDLTNPIVGGLFVLSLFFFMLLPPLGLASIVLRVKAYDDLTLLNPGFIKQKKYYLMYLALSIIFGIVVVGFSILLLPKINNGDFGTNTVYAYQIISSVLSTALVVVFRLVEYDLLKNIKVLGKGKDIGFRALQVAWYLQLANVIYTIVKSFINGIERAEETIDKITTASETIEETTPSVVAAVGSPFTVESVISLALVIIFTVCIVRVGVLLKRNGLLEVSTACDYSNVSSAEAMNIINPAPQTETP